MALTQTGIQKAREVNNELKGTDSLYDLREITTFMQSDANFNTFIEGTEFGQVSYEKWKTLVKLVSDDLYNCLGDMTYATDKYLDSLEKYNKGGF